ncbi:13455_t:CDS:1 [Acaulospora morrowiae]|uniref:13455_t:CDS:1 n=1 Tax=Acaulospora morrowiae TaxID=94023 RepID=A0A9N8WLU2_9GLOM|nr:13455_t:CDS:1 [Acaulospora morrowiae]
METGILPSKLSILDAIQMTATAWDKVTTNTIKNCWIKTGILSLLYDNTEIILAELEESIQRDNHQVQHSINKLLGNDNNVSVNDFLSIDDKLLSIEDYKESTEQEIIDCVLGKNIEIEADENTSEEIIEITNKEAIECLEKLQKYLNQENSMSVSFEWICQFNNIKNNILNHIMSKKV